MEYEIVCYRLDQDEGSDEVIDTVTGSFLANFRVRFANRVAARVGASLPCNSFGLHLLAPHTIHQHFGRSLRQDQR